HYIQLIALDTKKGFLIRRLDPTDKPEAFFCIDHDDEAQAVFAYCNLHGLWKTEL
ncbi:MAG: desulfoferrodoxin, partial [Eggerthellaceae bacterium]|nr:desulfoferrodoxin [Eggerthellaceae bacterium]